MEFNIGKEYSYQELAEFMKDKCVMYYGDTIIGKEAFHVVTRENKNYWFILNSATNQKYYYKCVYIN